MNVPLKLLAYKNIKKHYKKSFATAISIIFGFVGVLLLGGYMIRMEKYLTTQGIYLNHVGHISLYKKNGLKKSLTDPKNYSFSKSEQEAISKIVGQFPEVEKIGRFIHAQGLITNGCQSFPFFVWASEHHLENYIRNHSEVNKRVPLLVSLYEGTAYWTNTNEKTIVVTRKLFSLLQKKTLFIDKKNDEEIQRTFIKNCQGDEFYKLNEKHSGVTLMSNYFEGGMTIDDFDISGLFTTGFSLSEDNSMLMDLRGAFKFFGTDKVTSIALFLKDKKATNKILTILKNDPLFKDYDLYPYDDFSVNPFYVGAMRFVYVMNFFFFIIVCGVVLISLVNSIQSSVLERKNEIGTLLSIGFGKNQIVKIFTMEMMIISMISLFIGIVLSLFAIEIVNFLKIQFDIVGNADQLYLVLEMNWQFIILVITIILFLIYFSTKIITQFYLKKKILVLMERGN